MATSGGKDRLSAASEAITQSLETILQEPPHPFPDMFLREDDQPGHRDQGLTTGEREDRATSPTHNPRSVLEPKVLFQLGPFERGQDHVQR